MLGLFQVQVILGLSHSGLRLRFFESDYFLFGLFQFSNLSCFRFRLNRFGLLASYG